MKAKNPRGATFFEQKISVDSFIFGLLRKKWKSLQIMRPFFRHSVFIVISVFRSSHIKPKSFKITRISAVLSQIHVIALEVPTFGGKTVPQKPRISAQRISVRQGKLASLLRMFWA